jgi:uncharacterized protein with PQ loop repeat
MFVAATVFPIFGNILAVGLFCSSIKDVLVVRKSGDNGQLNSFPFVCLFSQCIAWTLYGMQINNVRVVFRF